jgi:hypothetical protein
MKRAHSQLTLVPLLSYFRKKNIQEILRVQVRGEKSSVLCAKMIHTCYKKLAIERETAYRLNIVDDDKPQNFLANQ